MYRINVSGTDYVAPDLATLQKWANEGRVLADTVVWDELSQVNRRAAEVPGLVFGPAATYAQPPGTTANYTRPGYAAVGQYEKVPNNLVLAIIATLCCCMPLGIASIVYAAQVDGLASRGEIAKAQDAANKAKTWGIAAIVLGVFSNGIYLVLTLGDVLR